MKKNTFIFYTTLISLIIISITTFFIYYNLNENSSFRNLKSISLNINKINDDLSSLVKDYTIDTNKTKKYLNESIQSLNTMSNSLSTLDIDSKNISIKNKLTSSINSTINLYDKCLSILSDPENIIDSSIVTSVSDLKNECSSTYSSLKENNIDISFNKDTDLFFENFIYYINTILKINGDLNFKNTQSREFIYKLQSLSRTLDVLNEDLFIAIDKIREDNRDLNVIIDDIYSKEKTYDDIKISIYSLSIPEGNSDIYDSLLEYSNAYKIYLNSIKESVILEKSLSSKDLTSKYIDKLYKDSKDKRQYSLDCYDNFKNKLKN